MQLLQLHKYLAISCCLDVLPLPNPCSFCWFFSWGSGQLDLYGAGVSLSAIADTKRYAVAGHRARNAWRRTLSVRAALLCPALVRIYLMSLRRSGTQTQDTLLSTLFESWLFGGGRRTERSSQDRTLNRGRRAHGGRNCRRRTERSMEDRALDTGIGAQLKTERFMQDSERSTIFSVWICWTLDALLCPLLVNDRRSSLSKDAERKKTEAATNQCSQTDAHLLFSSLAWCDKLNEYPYTNKCSSVRSMEG